MDQSNNGVTISSIEAILSPNVKAIALSWVNYTTGQVNSIQDIAEFVKNTVYYCLLMHAVPGVLPINLSKVKIDCISVYTNGAFALKAQRFQFFRTTLNQMAPTGAGVFSQHDRQLRCSLMIQVILDESLSMAI